MQKFNHLGSKIFTPIDNGGEVPKIGMFLTIDGDIGFAVNGQLALTITPEGIVLGDLGALVTSLKPYYAVSPPEVTVVTAGAATVMAQSQFEVQISKAASASHTVTLPPNPINGQIARVGDGKGDLALGGVTITVQGAAGATINGQAQHVMDYAWACATYRYSGTQWNIVGLV